MYKTLNGKTALVTGGSRGIGRAIAQRLAQEGATVALTYNESRNGVDEAVAAIENAGGSAVALSANLVDAREIPALFERLDDELIKRKGSKALDILVNSAGNSGWGGLADASPESWDTMFAVHARAPFFMIQSALSRLVDGGRIINISSAAGTRPLAVVPIYSMAKAGINNLICIGALQDSDLSARRLGDVTYGLYAAPDYLGRSGAPRTVDDLDEHDLIMKSVNDRTVWTLTDGHSTRKVSQSPRCTLDNVVAAKNLTLSGLGIAQLPRFMAEPHVRDGSLVRIASCAFVIE